MTTNQTIDGVPRELLECLVRFAGGKAKQEPCALLDKPYPSEDELIASGLGYPFSKEEAVQLYYSGFKTEPITVLEAWDAIGHDIGCNPSKEELLDSLRNMAAICEAHGNDMPATQPPGNTVAFPRELTDELAELIAEKAKVCGGGAFDIWEAICEKFGKPEQPAPVADPLSKGFTTLESDCGKYKIVTSFSTRDDAWSAYRVLVGAKPAPVALLAEAREWLGDGKHSDGMAREHWTPEYAALIDRIDATLRK